MPLLVRNNDMVPNVFYICTECKKPVSDKEVNKVLVPELEDEAQNYCPECFKSVNYDKILEHKKKKSKK